MKRQIDTRPPGEIRVCVMVTVLILADKRGNPLHPIHRIEEDIRCDRGLDVGCTARARARGMVHHIEPERENL